MDAKTETLIPADQLARDNSVRIPHESAEYREARRKLLAEEYELRRHIARIAEMRRALPPGAVVEGDYRFETAEGPSDFAGLFKDKQTLVVYNYMFGPERKAPCPMCTNLLDAWDGNADDVERNVSLVVVARSPIERLTAWKNERGWKNLRLVSDVNWDFTRDYVGPPAADENAGINVFTRRDGTIRHFWANEMELADPGQDPRGAPDPAPLWNVLDMTPEGRRPDWYPSLNY
jgi:predicted dithiol-disulfide oxidoreductase (DUF899 family)